MICWSWTYHLAPSTRQFQFIMCTPESRSHLVTAAEAALQHRTVHAFGTVHGKVLLDNDRLGIAARFRFRFRSYLSGLARADPGARVGVGWAGYTLGPTRQLAHDACAAAAWAAGYNTLEDARAPIIEYIRRQNRVHCEAEQDAKRAGPLHRHPDARVDVVLFFVAPHRLRPIDVDFIVELAAWVPVVRSPRASKGLGSSLRVPEGFGHPNCKRLYPIDVNFIVELSAWVLVVCSLGFCWGLQSITSQAVPLGAGGGPSNPLLSCPPGVPMVLSPRVLLGYPDCTQSTQRWRTGLVRLCGHDLSGHGNG